MCIAGEHNPQLCVCVWCVCGVCVWCVCGVCVWCVCVCGVCVCGVCGVFVCIWWVTSMIGTTQLRSRRTHNFVRMANGKHREWPSVPCQVSMLWADMAW